MQALEFALSMMDSVMFRGGASEPVSFLPVLAVGVITLIVVAVLGLVFDGSRGRRSRQGWATTRDVKRCGLLGREGIILGKWGRRGLLLRSAGPTHVFIAAATRSGKGAGFVVPNLLDWPGSVVVFDIKGENHELTAGFRALHGHEVILIDPDSPLSNRWNPLHFMSDDAAFRVRDLQRLAADLYGERTPAEAFWTQQARELFVGAAMLALETRGRSASLGHVHRFLSTPDLAGEVQREFIGREGDASGVSAACVQRLLQWAECGSEQMRAGILASARERLLLWSEPLLDRATSASDFRLAEVRRRRIAIYIRVAPGALARLAPVLRLFFEQFVQANTETPFGPETGNTVPVLLMLDEFPALGRARVMESAIAYMASYGLRCCIVAQSESQLRAVYGEDGARTLISNCANRIYFAPTTADEAAALSSALGSVLVPQRTRSRPVGLLSGSSRSVSVTLAERPLLRPHEARAMDSGASIVLAPGCQPIRAAKIRWWREPEFRCRNLPLPQHVSPPSRN